jgi:NAD(P)-dependent dehydrogenase (short-subunit alcohol dehydrogenase family)
MTTEASTTQSALITGAAKRIGRVLALALARKGYDIALHYHHSKREAEETAAAIRKHGGRCELFRCDLMNETETGKLVAAVKRKFKNLTVLVNNASIFKESGFRKKDLPVFRADLAVHLTAPFILSSDFAEQCRKGHIINLLETHIVRTRSPRVGYLLTKKALAEMTRMTAAAFAPKIRVNGIAPGLILAPERKMKGHLDRLAKSIPMKTRGSPRDLATALDFLLDNDFITGQIIFVDGGENLI